MDRSFFNYSVELIGFFLLYSFDKYFTELIKAFIVILLLLYEYFFGYFIVTRWQILLKKKPSNGLKNVSPYDYRRANMSERKRVRSLFFQTIKEKQSNVEVKKIITKKWHNTHQFVLTRHKIMTMMCLQENRNIVCMNCSYKMDRIRAMSEDI